MPHPCPRVHISPGFVSPQGSYPLFSLPPMKELQNLLDAFAQAQATGERAAIATVVKTSGSVYRRTGARMLITETGRTVGAISGGCLERDIVERAQPLIAQGGQPVRVQYDTTANQDLVWGLGLGCNGSVEVLIESLERESAQRPLALIAECWRHQQPGAIATIFQADGALAAEVGAHYCLTASGTVGHDITHPPLVQRLLPDISQVLASGHQRVVAYPLESGTVELFIERIRPPISLLLLGAGQDAVPVVQQAKQLGWQVTVIDHRPAYATRDRFPQADAVIVAAPPELTTTIPLTAQTVAVIMTHHYGQDQALLRWLLPSPIPYVGLLGSRQRSQQLVQELQADGLGLTESQLDHFYAPVGLDIGAETPEEIALAIVAEIQAVLANRAGQSLRSRQGPIHGVQPCLVLA